ncbi:hypothetical protein [Winogradskyella sp.]|uniref:hypothetical protein n=1 Tax=Winogradskyella sp. TaxID=1883156 RepID=UPI0025FAB171|nr:hypothetical protein [Winogradskyella sp.]MBT8245734.1 hypothetical protein [Winogradskyella sp.]
MLLLKRIFDFYINASIHVALAVYALVRITEIYYDLPYNQNLNYFIFFGTITGYNFVKYAGVAKLHHRSLAKGLQLIQVFSFVSFIALCYFAYQITIKTLLYTLPFAILTLLYAVPFLSGFEKNLRQISYLKIIVVALVWAAFTVFIPLIAQEVQFSLKEILIIFQRFLIVVVLILPFDIRDLNYDEISLQTIPQKIGLEKTKRLGIILLVFSLVLEYLTNEISTLKTPFMLFFFVTIVFLMRSKKEQAKYYSSFWVEAIPIIWWLLILGFLNL